MVGDAEDIGEVEDVGEVGKVDELLGMLGRLGRQRAGEVGECYQAPLTCNSLDVARARMRPTAACIWLPSRRGSAQEP